MEFQLLNRFSDIAGNACPPFHQHARVDISQSASRPTSPGHDALSCAVDSISRLPVFSAVFPRHRRYLNHSLEYA